MGKLTIIDSTASGQSIAPENEQSANSSGSITYLNRTDEDNQDDLFNAINQLDAVALPEHQE